MSVLKENPSTSISHYLIEFEDQRLAIVPSHRVAFPGSLPSHICSVHWLDRRLYNAVVLGHGTKEELEQKIITETTPQPSLKKPNGLSHQSRTLTPQAPINKPKLQQNNQNTQWNGMPEQKTDWYLDTSQVQDGQDVSAITWSTFSDVDESLDSAFCTPTDTHKLKKRKQTTWYAESEEDQNYHPYTVLWPLIIICCWVIDCWISIELNFLTCKL